MNDIQESVGYLLAQLCKAHRYAIDSCLGEIGLHVGQEMILAQLWDHDGQSQSQLAGEMCVEPPTVTKMLARMERAGLVERRSDPSDARVSRVFLTEDSRQIRSEVDHTWTSLEAKMLEGLTDAEEALLRRILKQMYENISG